jgi:hypothetical protein
MSPSARCRKLKAQIFDAIAAAGDATGGNAQLSVARPISDGQVSSARLPPRCAGGSHGSTCAAVTI